MTRHRGVKRGTVIPTRLDARGYAQFIVFEQSLDPAGFTFGKSELEEHGQIWHRARFSQIGKFHLAEINFKGDQIYGAIRATRQDGIHYSCTLDEYQRLLLALASHGYSEERISAMVILYPASMSHPATEGAFLFIYNEGTPEFEDLGVKDLLDEIPWGQNLPGVTIDERGNKSIPFGLASSCNLGRDAAGGGDGDLGTAFPRPLLNTAWAVDYFRVATLIARKVGVEYAMPEFLDSHPEFTQRYQRFCNNREIFDTPVNAFEALTVARLAIEPESRLKMHGDDHNCLVLPKILVFSRYLKASNQRESIIAYQRKSCSESMARMKKMEPTLSRCHDYLSRMPEPLRMEDVDGYLDYAGSDGSVVLMEKDTKKVVAHAKWTATSLSRWQTYMASVVHSFMLCHEKRPFSMTQVCEVAYSLVNLVSFFGFSVVMREWAEQGLPGCDREWTLVHAINQRLTDLFGSAVGGPCPRSTVHATRPIELKYIQAGVFIIFDLIIDYRKRWNTRDRRGKTLDDYGKDMAQEEFHFITKRLRTIRNCGAFTCQIVMSFLLMTGILYQPGLLDYASVTDANAAVQQNHCAFTDRDGSLLMAALAYRENISFSSAENLLCEALRKKIVYDLMLLGQAIYFLTRTNGNHHRRILKMAMEGSNGAIVETAPVFEARAGNATDITNVLWDRDREPTGMLVLCPPKETRSPCQYEWKVVKCIDSSKSTPEEVAAEERIESVYKSGNTLSWLEGMSLLKAPLQLVSGARHKITTPTNTTRSPRGQAPLGKMRGQASDNNHHSATLDSGTGSKRQPGTKGQHGRQNKRQKILAAQEDVLPRRPEMEAAFTKERELNKVVEGNCNLEVYRIAHSCLQLMGENVSVLTKAEGITHHAVPSSNRARDNWYYATIDSSSTDFSRDRCMDSYANLAQHLGGQTRFDNRVYRVVFLRKATATLFVLLCTIMDTSRVSQKVANYTVRKIFGDNPQQTVVAKRLKLQVGKTCDSSIFLAMENRKVFLLTSMKSNGPGTRSGARGAISTQWVFDAPNKCVLRSSTASGLSPQVKSRKGRNSKITGPRGSDASVRRVTTANYVLFPSDSLLETLPNSGQQVFDWEHPAIAKWETESSGSEDNSAKRSLPI